MLSTSPAKCPAVCWTGSRPRGVIYLQNWTERFCVFASSLTLCRCFSYTLKLLLTLCFSRSLSYVMCMGCFSFWLLGGIYIVTDVKGWWAGQPFVYPGNVSPTIKGLGVMYWCTTQASLLLALISPTLSFSLDPLLSSTLLRDELHLCVCWPLSPRLLFPLQLGDAFPGEPLGMALPKRVGNSTVGAHRLPAVQEEILPQNINQQHHHRHLSICFYSVYAVVSYLKYKKSRVMVWCVYII